MVGFCAFAVVAALSGSVSAYVNSIVGDVVPPYVEPFLNQVVQTDPVYKDWDLAHLSIQQIGETDCNAIASDLDRFQYSTPYQGTIKQATEKRTTWLNVGVRDGLWSQAFTRTMYCENTRKITTDVMASLATKVFCDGGSDDTALHPVYHLVYAGDLCMWISEESEEDGENLDISKYCGCKPANIDDDNAVKGERIDNPNNKR